jgi:hypothetical protein
MGLGTGVVLVLVGVLLSTDLVDLPGPLGSDAVDRALAIAGAVVIAVALLAHAARHGRGGVGR